MTWAGFKVLPFGITAKARVICEVSVQLHTSVPVPFLYVGKVFLQLRSLGKTPQKRELAPFGIPSLVSIEKQIHCHMRQ